MKLVGLLKMHLNEPCSEVCTVTHVLDTCVAVHYGMELAALLPMLLFTLECAIKEVQGN